LEYEASPAVGDDEISTSFRFAVVGSAPVEIVHMETSGGTTTASVDRTVFHPGERGEIKATTTIGLRRGRLGDTVTLVTRTAGAEDQEHDLFFGVDIPSTDQVLSFSRTILAWEIHQPIQPKELVIRVTQTLPIAVTAIEVVGDAFQAELTTVKAGREYRITVMPASNSRTASSTLTIVTDSTFPRLRRNEVVMVMSEPADRP
jgi:hypothetical protein